MTSEYGAHALRAGLARLYARMRTRKHTHTHQYVTLTAFPQQQWFRERGSLLRYTVHSCIVVLQQIYSN